MEKLLYIGNTGVGKAQPKDSKILTINGFVEMGSLKVGDKIIGSDGKEQVVKKIHEQGIREVVRIETKCGSIVECCEEHLWETENSKEKTIIVDTKELKKMFEERKRKPTLRVVKPIDFKEKEKDFIDPYLLGVLIGDGYLCGNITSFSTSEDDIVEKIKKCVNKDDFEVIKSKGENYSWTIKYKHYDGRKENFNPITRKTDEMGLRVKSYDKFIPKEYLYGTITEREQLLKGLMDTDGSVSINGTVSFSTTSKKLKDDFVELSRSLGYRPSVTYDGRSSKYTKNECFKIVLPKDFSLELPFSSIKHTKKIKALKGNRSYRNRIRIKSIEYTGIFKDMQCIEVSNEDRLYVTNGYVLTHNSRAITKLNPKETILIQCTKKRLPNAIDKEYVAGQNRFLVDKNSTIVSLINSISKSDKTKEIKQIVIDDWSFASAKELMARTNERGFDKFSEVAQGIVRVVEAVDKGREDITVIFISHIEVEADGTQNIKTSSKFIREKWGIIEQFEIVLVGNDDYTITTNGSPAKSPELMFENEIENDMQFIIDKIKKYYE